MLPSDSSPATSLSEEHQAARRLVDLLKLEQARLIKAEIEGLNALTEEKATTVSCLTELAQLRHRRLAEAGFAGQEAGMQAWLAGPGAGSGAEKSLPMPPRTLVRVKDAEGRTNSINATSTSRRRTRVRISAKKRLKLSLASRRSGPGAGIKKYSSDGSITTPASSIPATAARFSSSPTVE